MVMPGCSSGPGISPVRNGAQLATVSRSGGEQAHKGLSSPFSEKCRKDMGRQQVTPVC